MTRKILVICTLILLIILSSFIIKQQTQKISERIHSKALRIANDLQNIKDVEDDIQNDAKIYVDNFKVQESITLHIDHEKNKLIMYPEGFENQPFTMLINSNFYDNDWEFSVPEHSKETELSYEYMKYFKDAKKIVKNYVKYSKLIKETDKNNCINAIDTIDVCGCQFTEDTFKGILMVTTEDKIYVNTNLSEFIDQGSFIHELIHVVSNTTNKGSHYEFSSYRASNLNEAITDIIASKLSEKTEVSKLESTYETYFPYAYYMIDKFDILEAYYYSDCYENIISEIGQDRLDMLVLLLNNWDENSDVFLEYLCNDIMLTCK